MSGFLTKAFWNAFTLSRAWAEKRLPHWPLDKILALQDRRIRAMVAHAHATAPYYRDAMQSLGLRPGDIRSAADLAVLPLVDGSDLANEPDRFYSNAYSEPGTLTLHSSGTSGRTKAVRYDPAALFTALAHGQRQRVVMAHFVGRRYGYREMTAIRSESVSTQMRHFYESHSWVPRSVDLQRSILPLDISFDQAVARINDFQPEVVFGYGSHLGALFRWAWEHGHELSRPRVVWYGADAMPDADRNLIETGYEVPVLSSYQADEALRIGFQCEYRKGFHLNLDDVAVRVVKHDGKPAGPGEDGEIIISNLSNRATVLLNYKLGDVVTMSAGPCPCGRTLPTIERIAGRADDMVMLPNGESRHSLFLLQPLNTIPGVVQIQLVQERVDHISLYVVCAAGSDWQPIQASLADRVRGLLGEDMAVETVKVASIPSEPGGKVRAVISHCRQGHDR